MIAAKTIRQSIEMKGKLALVLVSVVTVPSAFLEPKTVYKFEVLAIEAGGNQTISEGEFTTQ